MKTTQQALENLEGIAVQLVYSQKKLRRILRDGLASRQVTTIIK